MIPLTAYVQALDHKCQFKLTNSGAVKMEGVIPASVADAIRLHSEAIRELVRFPMIIVRSSLFEDNRTYYWVPGDTQKHHLIKLGAEPGLVFTRSELAALVSAAKRGDDVKTLIELKQMFQGTVLNELSEGNERPRKPIPN